MSRLLIHEPPLMFQKSLANAVGLNEAIFIQQLHYWLLSSNNVRDGRKWVYKSRKEWLEGDFTFFSESTLKRVIANLRASGLLLVANYNKMKQDKTLWYSIDYEAFVKIDINANIKMYNLDKIKLYKRHGFRNNTIEVKIHELKSITSNTNLYS